MEHGQEYAVPGDGEDHGLGGQHRVFLYEGRQGPHTHFLPN
jgi:hypothetical protein